jgi:shikimate kinase
VKRLTLVGLSGSGKSTVGGLLAGRWGFALVDLDHAIEAVAGKSVAQIFETLGEPHFRRIERAELLGALEADRIVLAPGAGAPCQEGLMDALLADGPVEGPVVWLRGRPENLARRVAPHGDRPLLAGPDWKGRTRRGVRSSVATAMSTLASQLLTREIVYARAHHVVDVDDLDPERVANAVERALGQNGAPP